MSADELPDLIIPEWMERVDETDRLRLLGSRCRDCDTRMFPRRTACLRCSGTNLADTTLGPDAELYAYTVVPGPGDGRPTVVGQARFEGGPVVQGYVDGGGERPPSIGDAVEVVAFVLPASRGAGATTTFAFRTKGEADA